MDSLSSRILSPLALSKDDSLAIKGVAILLMIFHHYFGAYTVPVNLEELGGIYTSVWPLQGKVCVALFAFVTGYGLAAKGERNAGGVWKMGWSSFSSFYKIYLFAFVLMTFACYCFPDGGPNKCAWYALVLGILGIVPCYTDWWYASLHLVATLLFFPILLFMRRFSRAYLLVVIVCFCCMNLLIGSFSSLTDVLAAPVFHGLSSHHVFLITNIHFVVMQVTVFSAYFFIGFLWFESVKASQKSAYSKKEWSYLVLSWIMILGVAGHDRPILVWLLLGLVVLCPIVCKLMMCRIPLMVLGRYSVWMWLNHRCIFGYWFAPTFYSMSPWLAYLLIVVLSFVSAVILDVMFRFVCRYLASLRCVCDQMFKARVS